MRLIISLTRRGVPWRTADGGAEGEATGEATGEAYVLRSIMSEPLDGTGELRAVPTCGAEAIDK